MAAYVLSHAKRLGDKTAVEVVGDGSQSLTYAALEAAVLGTASGLRQHTLTQGDRILLRLGNTIDYPIAYLAAISIGVIPVPLSNQLTPDEIAKIEGVIKPELSLQSADVLGGNTPVLHAKDFVKYRDLPPAEYVLGDPNRPAYIVFTSGTSGQPRAVAHAHRAIWARSMMWDGWYGLRESDRLMHAGAFNWTFTLGTGLMDPWSIGATALIPRASTAPSDLPAMLADHKATLFAAAPGVYRQMMRCKVPALPALRHGLSAGEKMTDTDKATWQVKTCTTVFEAFGMSECSTFISGAPGQSRRKQAASYVQNGRNIALLGKNGPVPRGDVGTIAVHRSDPGLMLGYLDQPEETAARFDGDWFLTGDQAVMASDGAVTFVGRTDDMMNAGGYRVSPVEVEDALVQHPQITEVAACAVQLRTGVFVIAGFYVSTDVIDQEELQGFAAARLATYKTPRLYIACESLPRGANNKLLRQKLRKEWEAAHGQA
jgi:acyl-coenzyme A synthetase/AMP-(fatty) acid ligase